MSTPSITTGGVPPVAREDGPPWGPIIAAVGIVILVVLGLIFFTRSEAKPAHNTTDPYATNLVFSGMKMSASENFAGGTVTFLDGKLSNNGDKMVTGVEVEITFKNGLGEVVQKEAQPARVLQLSGPYPDTASLQAAPLRPKTDRLVRFTFEHISSDWNQQYPELRIVHVTFQQ